MLWTVVAHRIQAILNSGKIFLCGQCRLWVDLAIEAPEGLHAYIQEVRDAVPLDHMEGIVGAIVMNCNPFTLGHRHVVEYASHCVDRLYLFVVEEDRSFSRFPDRIELVRKGTADLSNVIVLRSGSFMISSTTFPGYFVKDDPGSVDVDPTLDVEVFGKLGRSGSWHRRAFSWGKSRLTELRETTTKR